MVKKNTKKSPKVKKKLVLNKRRTLIGLAVLLIAAGAIYVFSVWGYQAFYVKPREARIMEIYDSLDLGDKYIQQRADISGEKRTYEWDKGRSYSSYIEYRRGADVPTTMKELDEKVKAIGFKFIDEPYPGRLGNLQYHYKSDKGEYIRVSVESKPRLDAAQNFWLMNPDKDLPIEIFQIDPNQGPSNVTIKVNLDDNNE